MKYIFKNESISFDILGGKVGSNIDAIRSEFCFSCVLFDGAPNIFIKVEVFYQRKHEDKTEVRCITMHPSDSTLEENLHAYIKGYFCLPPSLLLRRVLSDMAVAITKNEDCFALLTADFPDEWVEFAREMYDWIVEKIIPVVQKEIEIHQTFFGDKKVQ